MNCNEYSLLTSFFFFLKMKHIYENIKMDGLKFTTKWVGAFIAEVSINT